MSVSVWFYSFKVAFEYEYFPSNPSVFQSPTLNVFTYGIGAHANSFCSSITSQHFGFPGQFIFKDTHFNRLDGLDIYIDDYSRPDPIPLAFLKQMHQSRVLRLFDDEPEAPHAAASPTADPDPARATAPAATDEGTAEPDFAQSPDGQHPGAVGGPGVPPANAPGQDVDRVAGLPDPTPERHG